MNKKLGIIAALACVLALSFTLVGCSQNIDKSGFLGSWTLESGSDSSLDAESIELMKSLGLEVTLELNEDGTGSLDLFGESQELTWEATSSTEGKMEIKDQGSATIKIEDGKLVLSDSSASMTFAKKS